MRYLITALTLLVIVPVAAVADEPAKGVGAAIRRGLKFLATDSVAWKKERNCVSCHHAAETVWAMREAKQRGHKVDEAVLAEMTKWIAESGDGTGRVQKRPEKAPRALNTYALYMALALAADANPDAKARDTLAKLRKNVKADQTDDGSWMAWPDTRPPIFGPSSAAMTALATLSLTNGMAVDDPALPAIRDKAVKWLEAAPPEDDIQAAALRLLVLHRLKRSDTILQPLVKHIVERQNPDGGWSQIKAMAGDAHATGQALYALAEAGLKPDHAVLKRGRDFLVKTQRPDGSWAMTSRPCPPSNKGAKSLMPITGAGSSWGVMGLVRAVRKIQ